MYSDFTGSHKYSEGPYSIEREQLRKKETTWHKNVAESLGKIFDKVNEVDERLDALVASISEFKNATEKQPEPTIKPGSDLQDVVASEVSQLLSDVQQPKNSLSGTETAPVQSGGGDVDAKLASMQIQIDALKNDLSLANESMVHLMNYLRARGTSKPLSLKGSVQDGKAVVYAVERV